MPAAKPRLVTTLIVIAACLAPIAGRLKFPSLYADDVVRLEQLQTEPATSILFKPFNEHMAPLFQGVSWLAWQAAGRSLANTAWTFTAASYLPYLLLLPLLTWLVGRETNSWPAALTSLALFSLSSLSIEVVYWYSASSFTWALLLTVVAWWSAVMVVGPFREITVVNVQGQNGDFPGATGCPQPVPQALAIARVPGSEPVAPLAHHFSLGRRVGSAVPAGSVFGRHSRPYDSWRSTHGLALAGLALATACAPAFSAIGLLAGPAAAVRVATGRGGRRQRLIGVAAAMLGVVLYLGVCSAFRYHSVVASNLERKANFVPGLLATLHATMGVLVPSVFGVRVGDGPGPRLGMALTLLALGGFLWQAVRRPNDRPLVLGGLLLMFGGYALALCVRPDEPGHPAIQTQRYHLFPMLGLILALAPGLKWAFERRNATPDQALRWALALTAGLWLVHHTEIQNRGRFYRHPDQARTLRALDRLGALCTARGVTRSQALAALDPIETEWTPPDHSALIMLGPGASRPLVADVEVKPLLLSALSANERRSICGGMDASPYLQAGSSASPVAVGREVARYRMSEVAPGRLVSAGYPSFVEYALEGGDPAEAHAIGLDGANPGEWVEVWWRGEREKWSETRSVRLRPGSATSPEGGWRLPLDRLPHWDSAESSRVRLLYHVAGEVAVGTPRLLR